MTPPQTRTQVKKRVIINSEKWTPVDLQEKHLVIVSLVLLCSQNANVVELVPSSLVGIISGTFEAYFCQWCTFCCHERVWRLRWLRGWSRNWKQLQTSSVTDYKQVGVDKNCSKRRIALFCCICGLKMAMDLCIWIITNGKKKGFNELKCLFF